MREASTDRDRCPACKSEDVEPLGIGHRGPIVASNWAVLPDAELRPCCCRGCGLVYESRGVRSSLKGFYQQVFAPTPMMRFYGDGRAQLVELIGKLAAIPQRGRLLEIGSGRGQFLRHFHQLYPGYQLTAIEPSVSFEALVEAVPTARVYRCGFEDCECPPGSQDIVVALSVIQSVADPLALLKWAARALRRGGVCFLEASNFETHPNSLVCGDHLSKLTQPALKNLAARAGLSVETIQPAGVPMYAVLRADGSGSEAPPTAYSENMRVARRNEQLVRGILQSVADARAAARRRGEHFAIFGLATAGLMAPFMLGFPPSDILTFIDENNSVWGAEVLGRPVGGPGLIRDQEIRHVALALSPVYAEPVAARLRALGAIVYTPAVGAGLEANR